MKKKVILLVCSALLLAGCAPSDSGALVETSGEKPPYEELSGEGTGWGFVKKKGSPPDVPEDEKEMMSRYDCYYMDFDAPKTLYLTFDEGYENGYTSKILDVLEKTHTPAAFFVTGPYLENQTVNHPNLPKQSVETVRSELDGLNQKCVDMYGVEMKYMRPPEGEYSERVLSVAQDMGYKTILWSFAYKDWDINEQKGADHAFSQVTPYLHDGAIILLHAVSSDNAAALEDIINYAKKEGYTFKSLDELQ